MIVCGADPGRHGALVALETDTRTVVATLPMPGGSDDGVDWARVDDWLAATRPTLMVIEKVHALPVGSRKSAFSFGANFGGLITLAQARRTPYELVAPQTWQKEILRDFDREDTKRASIAYADRAFPGVVPTTARGKRDDGVADALGLAVYGMRFLVRA